MEKGRVSCKNRGSVERGLSENRCWGNPDLLEEIVQVPRGCTWSLGCQHTHLAVSSERLQGLSQGVGGGETDGHHQSRRAG